MCFVIQVTTFRDCTVRFTGETPGTRKGALGTKP